MKRLVELISLCVLLAWGPVAIALDDMIAGPAAISDFSLEGSYALGGADSGSNQTTSLLAQWQIWRILDGDLGVSAGPRYTYLTRESVFQVGASKRLSLSRLDLHALNLMVGVEYLFGSNFSVGMNLDLFGFSVGNELSAQSSSGGSGTAAPKRLNLLLGGASDLGSLNSEFFVSYRASRSWAIKAGLSHQVIEYESSLETEKAQRFFDLAFIGVRIDI
jgi:hypothetical protein